MYEQIQITIVSSLIKRIMVITAWLSILVLVTGGTRITIDKTSKRPARTYVIPDGYPDAQTTGIKGAGLTEDALTKSGFIEVKKEGAVIELLDVSGGIFIHANNVTIRKCLIRGGLYGVHCQSYSGITIEYCTFIAGEKRKGIMAHDVVIRNCDISGYQDGIWVTNNVIIEDNYIHDLYMFKEAHADGIQSSGGAHNIIRHNTIIALDRNAAIIFRSRLGPIDDVLIEDNILLGGNYTMYIRGKGTESLTNITVKNNIFVKQSYSFGALDYDVPVTFINNSYDTGEKIP